LHKRVLVGYENEISEGSIETIEGARTALFKLPEKPDHIRDPLTASVFANPPQFATVGLCGNCDFGTSPTKHFVEHWKL